MLPHFSPNFQVVSKKKRLGHDGRPLQASTVSAQEYPMYVMHVKDFLEISGTLRPHQELLRAGKLRRLIRGGNDNVIFVSHQWLDWDHPDYHLRQISVAQRVLHRMSTGNMAGIEIHYVHQMMYPGHDVMLSRKEMRRLAEKAYIWYDFISVPQPGARNKVGRDNGMSLVEQGAFLVADHRLLGREGLLRDDLERAVRSIPAYIEQCSHMMVLVPTCISGSDPTSICDYRSWRRRGWCILELQGRLLSRGGDDKVIVVQSAESTPWLMLPLEASRMQVGAGEFTSPGDRAAIGIMLNGLIRGKLSYLAAKNELLEHNFLNAIAPRILEGCFESEINEPLLHDKTGEAAGWTSLRFAVIRRDVDVVRLHLAACGRSMESPLTRDFPDLFRKKGMTILHEAMYSSTSQVVALLLDAGADVTAVDAHGHDALMWAVIGGSVDNVCYWLGRFPRWILSSRDRIFGYTSLLWCFYLLHERTGLPIAHRLLDAGADPCVIGDAGGNILHLATACDDASLGMVRLALRYVPVDQRIRARSLFWALLYRGFRGALRLGAKKKYVEVFAHSQGMTALHKAAMCGNVPVVRILLHAGADKTLRTALGLTPLEISEVFGPFPAVEELLR